MKQDGEKLDIIHNYLRIDHGKKAKPYYIECPRKAKKFCGRKTITLLVLLDKDIVKAQKWYRSLEVRQLSKRRH